MWQIVLVVGDRKKGHNLYPQNVESVGDTQPCDQSSTMQSDIMEICRNAGEAEKEDARVCQAVRKVSQAAAFEGRFGG